MNLMTLMRSAVSKDAPMERSQSTDASINKTHQVTWIKSPISTTEACKSKHTQTHRTLTLLMLHR